MYKTYTKRDFMSIFPCNKNLFISNIIQIMIGIIKLGAIFVLPVFISFGLFPIDSILAKNTHTSISSSIIGEANPNSFILAEKLSIKAKKCSKASCSINSQKKVSAGRTFKPTGAPKKTNGGSSRGYRRHRRK
jgi:hypothetical protein